MGIRGGWPNRHDGARPHFFWEVHATGSTACHLFFRFFMVKTLGPTLGMAAAAVVGFLTFERMVGFNGRPLASLLLAFLYFLPMANGGALLSA
ncbi:MAG: hypothetical protein IPM82_29960 [Saprospiraceae bacterium]|nr:hypothetical protein [Saprospiraceae bacterium]